MDQGSGIKLYVTKNSMFSQIWFSLSGRNYGKNMKETGYFCIGYLNCEIWKFLSRFLGRLRWFDGMHVCVFKNTSSVLCLADLILNIHVTTMDLGRHVASLGTMFHVDIHLLTHCQEASECLKA